MEKPTFTLSDGRTVELDLYRLKAKHIRAWAQYSGTTVPVEEILTALSIATGLTVEEIDDLPVPDFVPISNKFGDLMKAFAASATAPEKN